MGHFLTFQPVPADYPNHLATPQPERLQLPSARWLLPLLLLLCLVPRALMALRIPSVCPDGVLYIHLAEALEAGDFRVGFGEMSLNVYPIVLMLLHRLGIDWELAAALWGVTVSSLVVLPLWGWVRRQFDDRVALVACLLYAVNPKMIEWSPEAMRDPTFWLLFMLAIYWLWRAVTEVRYGYFLAAGAAITLAALTRIEGLFLLIPLALWTFWRFLALGTNRRKLLLGATLCVVVFPTLLALVNLGWVYQRAGWTAPRLTPLTRVQPWLESLAGQAAETGDHDGLEEQPMTVGRMAWTFFPTMTRGLSPVFALLMFGGIWGWLRVWSRRDHQPLFYTAVVIMCGIWVQLWSDKSICPRYALPIVLMASPLAALGLLGLMARLLRVAERLQWGAGGRRAAVAAVVAVVVGISLGDAMTGNAKYFETRRMAADVGFWLREEFPASSRPTLVGPVGITPIVSYYAGDVPYQAFRWQASDELILAMIDQHQPGVVLLQLAKQLTAQRCAALVERMKRAGLRPVNHDDLPDACHDLRVLVRADKAPRQVVRGPSQTR